MLLRDLIVAENNTAVICKGFIDSILKSKHSAILQPYLNEPAINDMYGLLMYTFENLSIEDMKSLYQFGDDLDTFMVEQYSNDITTLTWGEVTLTHQTVQALVHVTKLFDTWRTNNGWEDPGWITDNMSEYENIVVTSTDEHDITSITKNKYDNVPPYVITTQTQSQSTLVVIIQPNITNITMPLFDVALRDLGLLTSNNTVILYPAIGIGVTTASILCTVLRQLHVPLHTNNIESKFDFTLNIIHHYSQIIKSNIKLLSTKSCHPRLRTHAVIKYVSNNIMISIAKVIETSF